MTTAIISDNSSGSTYAGVEDCHILQGSTGNFNGTTLDLRTDGSQDRHVLIRFTGLSNIPAGATVTSAFLRLTAVSTTVRTWTGYESLKAWTETGADWFLYDNVTSWANNGGVGTGDSDASSSCSGTSPGSATTFDLTFDAHGLSVLESQLADGADGFIFVSSGGGTFQVVSSEGTDGSRPELHLTYTAGQTVAVGLTTESDTVPGAATVLKNKAVGLTTETESALAATPDKAVDIEVAEEADNALAATVSGGAFTITTGLPEEEDSGIQVSWIKEFPVGLATETDSAFSTGARKVTTVGIATEVDFALKLVGQSTSTVNIYRRLRGSGLHRYR